MFNAWICNFQKSIEVLSCGAYKKAIGNSFHLNSDISGITGHDVFPQTIIRQIWDNLQMIKGAKPIP